MAPLPTPDDLCRSWLDLQWHFDPAEASLQGVREADPRLGDWDAEAVQEYLAATRSIAGAVEGLDVEEISGEIDRTALLDLLRVEEFRIHDEAPHRHDPALWVHHLITACEALLRLPPDADSAAAASDRLDAVPRFLATARLRLAEPPSVFLDTARAMLPGLGTLLQAVVARFAPFARDPAAFRSRAEAALRDLIEFGIALRDEMAVHAEAQAFAVGEDDFERRLHHEHAQRGTAAELWRHLMHAVEDTLPGVEEAASRIDPDAGWREILERVATEEAGDPVAAVAAWLPAARRHAVESGLVSDGESGADELELVLAREPETIVAPWGRYRPAGIRDGEPPAVLSVSAAATAWRGPALTAVVGGVPGMHLLGSAQRTLDSAVRRLPVSTGRMRGWGLHAADLMAGSGFLTDPADWLRYRVLRYGALHLALVDIGMHTRQWSATTAVEHLALHLPWPPEVLLAEVRRIAREPTVAVAAVLGAEGLAATRRDWTANGHAGEPRSAATSALLQFGGLPVTLIRWGLDLDS